MKDRCLLIAKVEVRASGDGWHREKPDVSRRRKEEFYVSRSVFSAEEGSLSLNGAECMHSWSGASPHCLLVLCLRRVQ